MELLVLALTSVCYHPELIRPSLWFPRMEEDDASSPGPNFTLPPGVSPHSNPRDLIAELCQIIERQSQELLALRQEQSQEQGAQATSVLRCARCSAAVALGPASAANFPAGRLSWQAASHPWFGSCPQAVNAGEAGEQPGVFDPTGSPCSCTILSCSSSPQIQPSNPAPSPASAQGLIHGSPTLPSHRSLRIASVAQGGGPTGARGGGVLRDRALRLTLLRGGRACGRPQQGAQGSPFFLRPRGALPAHACHVHTVLTLALGPRPECSEQGLISRWRLTLALA